jgi:hypothetical protein
MKVAFKLPRSKITWMIIAIVVVVLGYLVYKRVFVYKEGKHVNSKKMCKVNNCADAGDNCSNAIKMSQGEWYKCSGSKKNCKTSSEKYKGDNITSLKSCKND